MGKRKSSSKPQGPKKREPLATVFTCLFCNHENSAVVTLNRKLGVGDLECKTCGQIFQTDINYLSAPVDVFAAWVDAADEVAQQPDESYPEGRPGVDKQGAKQSTASRGRYEEKGSLEEDDDYS